MSVSSKRKLLPPLRIHKPKKRIWQEQNMFLAKVQPVTCTEYYLVFIFSSSWQKVNRFLKMLRLLGIYMQYNEDNNYVYLQITQH